MDKEIWTMNVLQHTSDICVCTFILGCAHHWHVVARFGLVYGFFFKKELDHIFLIMHNRGHKPNGPPLPLLPSHNTPLPVTYFSETVSPAEGIPLVLSL